MLFNIKLIIGPRLKPPFQKLPKVKNNVTKCRVINCACYASQLCSFPGIHQVQFIKKELLGAMQAIDELFNANQVRAF